MKLDIEEQPRTTLPVLDSLEEVQDRTPLMSSAAQFSLLDAVNIPKEFDDALVEGGVGLLRSSCIETLQLNLGKVCNQTCRHCHVDAGPRRTEVMDKETIDLCLQVLEKAKIPTLDITGGAPELNPHFRYLVQESFKLGVHIMDRCNLTILETAPYRDMPDFFAKHGVEVVCSLPHYRALHTDKQRGDGVFEKSIRALRKLNAVGYGQGDPKRMLTLVTNPVGAFLPGTQASLELEWKQALKKNFDIDFDRLFTITNMPISRYLEWLQESGNVDAYMQKIAKAFNPAAAKGLMCKTTLSVSYDGKLYDCDFNQMLEMEIEVKGVSHIRDFAREKLEDRLIRTARHCYGCTAGAGSSCGGQTV